MSKPNEPELDRDERELLASYERGEWAPTEDQAERLAHHREIARNTQRKDKRVNIRISSKDLEELQTIAAEDGIPYQTLMSSVLHRFVNGRLVDKRSLVK